MDFRFFPRFFHFCSPDESFFLTLLLIKLETGNGMDFSLYRTRVIQMLQVLNMLFIKAE